MSRVTLTLLCSACKINPLPNLTTTADGDSDVDDDGDNLMLLGMYKMLIAAFRGHKIHLHVSYCTSSIPAPCHSSDVYLTLMWLQIPPYIFCLHSTICMLMQIHLVMHCILGLNLCSVSKQQILQIDVVKCDSPECTQSHRK